MQPLILMTNTSNDDIYLSVLKYCLYSISPQFNILEYYIKPHHSSVNKAAAYILLNNHSFQPHTIFYLEINISQKIHQQKILLIQYHNKWIFTPDNGIVGLLEKDKIQNIYSWKETIKSSFYAKNEMLNALKCFIENTSSVTNDFKPISSDECTQIQWPDIVEKDKPSTNTKKIFIPVLYIDKYDNIILNLKKETYNVWLKNYDISVHLPFTEHKKISSTYNDGNNNETIILFNDAGYMEIANNGGHIASLTAHKDIFSEPTYLITIELKPKL